MIAISSVAARSRQRTRRTLTVVLELLVVVVEVALLRVANGIALEGVPAAPLRVSTAIVLSVVGNEVATGLVVGVVALLRAILR